MSVATAPIYVVQHTSGEFLGLIEDHLEGRGLRFTYFRPFTTGGGLPASMDFAKALILLGGGPWGSHGKWALPNLKEELALTWASLARGKPVIGIGLGAQILAIAAGGGTEPAALTFEVGEAQRVRDGALNGFLPETYPLAIYMRDRPLPPKEARILAEDRAGRPALFQVAGNCLGFTGHPGAKRGMAEDLIMEFDDAPDDPGPALAALGEVQPALEDSLVKIMTGLVQVAGLMQESQD